MPTSPVTLNGVHVKGGLAVKMSLPYVLNSCNVSLLLMHVRGLLHTQLAKDSSLFLRIAL